MYKKCERKKERNGENGYEKKNKEINEKACKENGKERKKERTRKWPMISWLFAKDYLSQFPFVNFELSSLFNYQNAKSNKTQKI